MLGNQIVKEKGTVFNQNIFPSKHAKQILPHVHMQVASSQPEGGGTAPVTELKETCWLWFSLNHSDNVRKNLPTILG